ncbi:MAG TPA: UDP-N-acetylglucosamine 2-epimerase (non-hydrolyzing) [Flavipsychrobacter sp.]|nr:UDP-N-acetylglucosamine 2-epimerase (non-hydrolyzing) [Flavipsychrobacter sp.]
MLVDIIAAAKPNFLRIAPVIDAIHKNQKIGKDIKYRLIYIGPHYDKNATAVFFSQLSISRPNINIEIPSITQAEETAFIMLQYEKIVKSDKPDLLLVTGSSTSAMACTIAAKKIGKIHVCHLDAGVRNYDTRSQQEVNRVLIDSVSDYYFTSSHAANENLRQVGISEEKIFIVGNTLIDTLSRLAPHFNKPSIWQKLELQLQNYFVITLQQHNNIEDISRLKDLLVIIAQATYNLPVILFTNPRIAESIQGIGLKMPNLYIMDIPDYLQFNYLVENAMAVITDSTMLQEETTVMGVPCISLQDTTEKPETYTIGTNELIGTNPEAIPGALSLVFSGKWKRGNIPYLWDGRSAGRILEVLNNLT